MELRQIALCTKPGMLVQSSPTHHTSNFHTCYYLLVLCWFEQHPGRPCKPVGVLAPQMQKVTLWKACKACIKIWSDTSQSSWFSVLQRISLLSSLFVCSHGFVCKCIPSWNFQHIGSPLKTRRVCQSMQMRPHKYFEAIIMLSKKLSLLTCHKRQSSENGKTCTNLCVACTPATHSRTFPMLLFD